MTRTILAAAALLATGCAKNYIPNTEVEDTEENRSIIEFCESYRIALEARDLVKILSVVSDDYYEDSGTPVGTDDYDRVGLERVLAARFERVEAIRYDIRYRRILYYPDRVEVLYSFYGRFQVASEGEGEPRWFSKVGDNRLVLARTQGGLRILSGL